MNTGSSERNSLLLNVENPVDPTVVMMSADPKDGDETDETDGDGTDGDGTDGH